MALRPANGTRLSRAPARPRAAPCQSQARHPPAVATLRVVGGWAAGRQQPIRSGRETLSVPIGLAHAERSCLPRILFRTDCLANFGTSRYVYGGFGTQSRRNR